MIKDFLKGKSICIIGAHTDDIELGMGATLNQIKEFNPNIHVFSSGTTEKGEFSASMDTYGIEQPTLDEYPARGFYTGPYRQLIRDRVFNWANYDVFFTHSIHSQHLDHRIVGEAVDDIIKDKTIICWEEVHSGKNIPINFWNEFSADDLAAKFHALDCYKSQAKRPYFEGDHIATLARYRGNQILRPYAEAFNLIRLVL